MLLFGLWYAVDGFIAIGLVFLGISFILCTFFCCCFYKTFGKMASTDPEEEKRLTISQDPIQEGGGAYTS